MNYEQLYNRDIRRVNRNRVYRLIYDQSEISRPEIAQLLGISLPTAIQNIKLLQEDGLIVDGDTMASTGGRKAISVTCVANARYAIGIDITLNEIKIVVINLKAEIVHSHYIQTPFQNTSEYYNFIEDTVNTMIKKEDIEPKKILGVGFSIPGILSDDHQLLIHSHILNISGLQCERMKHSLPYPATLCNDANAAGLSELWSGQANKNVVYLSLSNTVGGAIILGEKLYFGDSQRAGEFGHMTLVRNGLPCYCGKRGCLDAYCSAKVLSSYTDDNLDAFFKKLKNNDLKIKNIWTKYLEWLAVALNNLTSFFDCRIILGGYLGRFFDEYLEDLQKLLAKQTTFSGNENYVSICKYKMDAAAVGAALLYVRSFIEQI